MTAQERKFIDRVDGVIRAIASLTPKNPADIAAISENLRIATMSARLLQHAISAFRSQDWADVEHWLTSAERAAS